MKKIRLLSLLTTVLSVVLSIVLFFIFICSSTYETNFSGILAPVIICKALLIVGISSFIFFILSFIIAKKQYDSKKLTKIFISGLSIGLLLTIVFAIKGYTSEKIFHYNSWDDDEIHAEYEQYLPYNDLFKAMPEMKNNYEVGKTYADLGIKYVYSDDISFNDNLLTISPNYKAEYFTSKDHFLNYKFILDRTVPLPSNDLTVDVDSKPVSGEIDGIHYNLYVQDDNYAIAISNKKGVFYSYLEDIEGLNISTDDFIETAVKQYHLMQNSVKLGLYEF